MLFVLSPLTHKFGIFIAPLSVFRCWCFYCFLHSLFFLADSMQIFQRSACLQRHSKAFAADGQMMNNQLWCSIKTTSINSFLNIWPSSLTLVGGELRLWVGSFQITSLFGQIVELSRNNWLLQRWVNTPRAADFCEHIWKCVVLETCLVF